MSAPVIPAYYALHFAAMSETARSLGYALALHGSMTRDLDVVAVPWIEDAVYPDELVAVLAERHGMRVSEDSPKAKPHGRQSWTLMMGGEFYVDLSVTPRKTDATTPRQTVRPTQMEQLYQLHGRCGGPPLCALPVGHEGRGVPAVDTSLLHGRRK